jgi:hypothetical protein
MHDIVRSEIHIVRDVITEKECHDMDEAAKPLLRRASVADGKGGSTVSLNRKAIQAVLKLAWDMEADGDFIGSPSRQVYDCGNYVTGFNIRESSTINSDLLQRKHITFYRFNPFFLFLC